MDVRKNGQYRIPKLSPLADLNQCSEHKATSVLLGAGTVCMMKYKVIKYKVRVCSKEGYKCGEGPTDQEV